MTRSDWLLTRVRAEYLEMVGLRLPPAQACRLCRLAPATWGSSERVVGRAMSRLGKSGHMAWMGSAEPGAEERQS